MSQLVRNKWLLGSLGQIFHLHASMQQRQRLKALDRFRNETLKDSGESRLVLLATDVAARGLDITQIRTVIHYQVFFFLKTTLIRQ